MRHVDAVELASVLMSHAKAGNDGEVARFNLSPLALIALTDATQADREARSLEQILSERQRRSRDAREKLASILQVLPPQGICPRELTWA